MIFRETIQSDLDYMTEHSVSRGIQNKQPDSIEYLYTLEHEDKVLGTGGFRLINTTTAWCWVDISDEMKKGHLIVSYRILKEWIDLFVEEHGIKRLQAYIRYDFPEAVRMVEHLGFGWESNMKNFMPEGDAMMYRRLLT